MVSTHTTLRDGVVLVDNEKVDKFLIGHDITKERFSKPYQADPDADLIFARHHSYGTESTLGTYPV
jgi:hypothetical protein